MLKLVLPGDTGNSNLHPDLGQNQSTARYIAGEFGDTPTAVDTSSVGPGKSVILSNKRYSGTLGDAFKPNAHGMRVVINNYRNRAVRGKDVHDFCRRTAEAFGLPAELVYALLNIESGWPSSYGEKFLSMNNANKGGFAGPFQQSKVAYQEGATYINSRYGLGMKTSRLSCSVGEAAVAAMGYIMRYTRGGAISSRPFTALNFYAIHNLGPGAGAKMVVHNNHSLAAKQISTQGPELRRVYRSVYV